MSPDRPTKDPTPPPGGNGGDAEPISREAYVRMHGDPRFVGLKKRLYAFIFPMSIAFMAWYLLYVLMSAYGREVMGTVLFGNVNVALLFGLLQFLSTFGIAILYTSYARRKLDAQAVELRDELQHDAMDKESGR
ncbi:MULTISPECIES: DUF485 domain-containing protein [Nocardiopsis]|uniref:Uncharacterized membrane protein (DUF485 family) n=1 Tax=Nocardiopsis sinuspersici TaxID=501010 RepID=A0A1V3C5I9_9ACTN|nr:MULTISPECIES: DUF485 domain-containing protein [Nocardiopsis]NYH52104.1 uncharacterized membrane protein (DUF485 family) [Nocardiopsis sinuspersici]OOC55650.1 hypothetical protein NOSIN_18960 [Nocardiopsis sinuspersici]